MLRIDKSQMRYLKADTGEELERAYNSLIDRLSRQAVRIEDRIISVDTFAAIILYSFKESIPQCLKDEYELEGVFPKCSDCPHFKDIGHGNGDCMKIEHVDRRGNHVTIRGNDDICNCRWNELEDELARRKIAVRRATKKLKKAI